MTPEPLVTIAIPTYNRAELLANSIQSALEQDFNDIRLLILDNASTDNTREVIESFNDSRIEYAGSETNTGLFRNWNRALQLNSSPYLCILQDDDEILPGFIRQSVAALEENPGAGFSFTHTRFIGIKDELLHLQDTKNITPGKIHGLDFLHQIVAGDNWVVHVSSVLMRSSALKSVGEFDIIHSRHAIEFNLYFRMAAQFDLVFIPVELTHVRLHSGQDHVNNTHGTGPLAMLAERIDVIAHLLKSDRAESKDYRDWLAERLLTLCMARSELTLQLIPELNLTWNERLAIVQQEVSGSIPAGERIIVADENSWDYALFSGYDVVPYPEHDGEFWGSPSDDQSAIQEVERQRLLNAHYFVIGWPAFWWLDYYIELREYLQSRYRCILSNSRIVVYDLRQVMTD
jgi:glycosyltransferase involved in cell wall biosynthesis